ncbi:MAG: hypothetical protein MUF87_00125 [Anaerolineae bacterium]|jgi:hypothetical protein|nr:hypothetical protein [Anaerolineae bacterium]
MEGIALIASFALTLMILSYLLGDNPLYRLAVYTLIGLTAGFITIVTVESVLIPWFESTVLTGQPINIGIGLIPVLFGVLLLFKTSPRLGQAGNLALAFLVGVGAAVALVGIVTGTLIPLTLTIGDAFTGNLLNTLIVFIGVITSLIYFQYALVRKTPQGTVERTPLMKTLGGIGFGFIITTLGALYAAAILTSLTILIERIGFWLTQLTGG